MTHDRRHISLLAGILVFKHGHDAPAVAAHRVRLWTEAHDPETADFWRAVGEAIVHWLAQPQREPSLADVLGGSVTRRTMDADGVRRKHVEALMADVRKRRRRNG